MAYKRKQVIPPDGQGVEGTAFAKAMSDGFLETARGCDSYIVDAKENGNPTMEETVFTIGAMGGVLFEQLSELAIQNGHPEHIPLIVEGTCGLFKSITDKNVVYKETNRGKLPADPHVVVFNTNPVTKEVSSLEMTVEEGQQVVRRSAIAYALVGGLATAAMEAFRNDKD